MAEVTTWDLAMLYLHKQIKISRNALHHAELKKGVRAEEVRDIRRKIQVLEYIFETVRQKGEM